MKTIETQIQKLELCLKKFCEPMYNKLLDPMQKETIESILTPWGYDDNLISEIFQWKGGIINDGSL